MLDAGCSMLVEVNRGSRIDIRITTPPNKLEGATQCCSFAKTRSFGLSALLRAGFFCLKMTEE